METTAGSVKSATIPSGKDRVDVDLITSKEFGPVTITAKSGNRKATARVDFVVEKGTIEVRVQPDSIPADGKSSAAVTVSVRDDKGSVVAPLEEKAVDLKTTLGTIPGSMKWQAKAPSVSVNITSGDVSGTAIVTATVGDLRGEGKVAFAGMPKRFCMHCGTAMSLEAAQCPKCGKTPPSGVDTKQCPTCSTVIPEAARFCHHCGARQPDKP
jgi:RNA polymerase subunit RPABC4/transcription elongation factor Spt4